MPTLSASARQEYYVELGNGLPPPVTDAPDHRRQRIATAIDAFGALAPGDAFEARLAVQIVLCSAHASQCLHEAGRYHDDFPKRKSCRAQAASLMREARAARCILAQQQKHRLRPDEPIAAHTQPAAAPRLPAPVLQASAPPRAPSITQAEAPPRQAAAASSPAAKVGAAPAILPPAPFAAPVPATGAAAPTTKAALRAGSFFTDPAVTEALRHGATAQLRAARRDNRAALPAAA